MKRQTSDLIHVIVERPDHRVVLHVLLGSLVHHHLSESTAPIPFVYVCTRSTLFLKAIQNNKQGIPPGGRGAHFDGHGALGEHALRVQNLDGSVGGARGYELAIAAVRSYPARPLVRCHIAGLVLRSLWRHGLDVSIELQINTSSWRHRVRAPYGILHGTVIVLHPCRQHTVGRKPFLLLKHD